VSVCVCVCAPACTVPHSTGRRDVKERKERVDAACKKDDVVRRLMCERKTTKAEGFCYVALQKKKDGKEVEDEERMCSLVVFFVFCPLSSRGVTFFPFSGTLRKTPTCMYVCVCVCVFVRVDERSTIPTTSNKITKEETRGGGSHSEAYRYTTPDVWEGGSDYASPHPPPRFPRDDRRRIQFRTSCHVLHAPWPQLC
jgi:hypothetical protein